MAKSRANTRPEISAPRFALIAALLLPLVATGGAQAQTVRIQPTLDTRLTWTDNVDTEENGQQDWIAEISPGVSISRESGRFSGGLNMRLRNIVHAEQTEDNTTYLALQGTGTVEAIEDAFFIDLGASISRDNRSAFSGRFPGDTLDNDKNNETRLFSVGPRFGFRFGESGQGNIGYQQRWLTGGSNTLGDRETGTWRVGLSDPVALRLFGWGLDYARTDTRYDEDAARDVTEEVGRATLFINIDPQFRLRAIGGYESNDYSSVSGESGAIWGAGFDWYPNERTAISATGEDRIFGNGYNVNVQHRMARSVLSFSATRDISSSLDELGETYLLTPQNIADLADLIETDPDAVQDYLAGLTPTSIRTNRYFISEALRAAFTLIGVRHTLTFSVSQTDRSQLDTLGYSGLINDEFDTYDRVKTRSASVSLDHKLSGLATLRLSAQRSKSQGYGDDNDETTRTGYTLGVTRSLSPNTSGSLTYRHIKSEGSDSYTENAVTAVLGMRF
jgi:uncharacterized protein (PEP-CTERM system associated)